jgi:hypothetical protein
MHHGDAENTEVFMVLKDTKHFEINIEILRVLSVSVVENL